MINILKMCINKYVYVSVWQLKVNKARSFFLDFNIINFFRRNFKILINFL